MFRPLALVAGATAIVAMTALTSGCGTTKETPTTTPATPTTTTTTPAATTPAVPVPTEKAVGPGDTNSFSPTVDPVQPGSVCKQIVNGVCMR